MAGYSGTPLPQKLGIKEDHVVAFLGAPPGFDATLGALPRGVEVRRDARGEAKLDIVVAFTRTKRELVGGLAPLAKQLDPAGGLWVAWPKKSSGVATDMTEDVVREHALAIGLVDNKVCAIDDVWSGLRLVYRLADRPKPAKTVSPAPSRRAAGRAREPGAPRDKGPARSRARGGRPSRG